VMLVGYNRLVSRRAWISVPMNQIICSFSSRTCSIGSMRPFTELVGNSDLGRNKHNKQQSLHVEDLLSRKEHSWANLGLLGRGKWPFLNSIEI
jgi:hypothetical protein